AEVLGGPATPGVGFGMGLERVLMVLEEEGLVPDLATGVQVYVCHDGPPWEEEALRLVDFLRGSGLRADRDLLGRSLRAQLRAASRSGARWAVLVGVAEVPSGYVVLRDLQAGEQRPVPADQLPRILVQEEGECGRTGAAS
ncbi:MAG: His/Gly/Thr/Pro-type tRNA ligase C-terminal domain-containing protein, partial [Armatimonadota bacterium]|nr:His/Gly/Thr/Pro-type tRNA ligase C-terminal domain-containing protein [Armatimonadota bacterium]